MSEIRSYGERTASPLSFDLDDGRTKQSFAEETDINSIMGKWRRTGSIEHLASTPPRYGDFTNASDYQTAVNSVAEANSLFMGLPAMIRRRMNNSPAYLLTFLANSANDEEAIELGLLENPVDPKTPPPLEPRGETPPEGGEGEN